MEKSEWIWMNGEFVAWDDAQVHVLSHGLHYGTGVFEGIRCYETDRGPAVFRHREHLQRLAETVPAWKSRANWEGIGSERPGNVA